MEWTPRPLVEHLREQERHNVTVITVGSKYEVYVRSPASSHMQTLKQPFQTLAIKWEVKYIWKEVFLRLPSCFLSFLHTLSFMHLSFCVRPSLLLLSRYDAANGYTTLQMLAILISGTQRTTKATTRQRHQRKKWIREGSKNVLYCYLKTWT